MSKTKTAWLWCRYFLINGLFAVAIYFGWFAEMNGGTNIEGAENLALFMGWITGIGAVIILLGLWADEHGEKKGDLREALARHDQSPVPFWFDLLFDIVVTAAFVWTGHYILAFFYILAIFAGKALRDIPKNLVLNKLKSQQS